MELLETVVANPSATGKRQDLEILYEKAFPAVARYISRRGGSLDDAKDIFHDAMIIYYEKKIDGNLKISVAGEAYLLGIAKHLWARKFNKDHAVLSLNDSDNEIFVPEDNGKKVNSEKLMNFLERTGKKCLDLLRAFYFEKSSVKEIASGLGYSSEHSASVQKYKCLEKVRDTIKEKLNTYEDFIE